MKNLKTLLCLLLAASAVGCAGGGRANGGYYMTAEGCCFPVDCECCSDGNVVVRRCMPSEAPLGEDFNVTLTATAKCNASNVVVTEHIPDGLEYVSSVPAAKIDGNNLHFELGTMCCGECQDVCITYRGMVEGCITTCYQVSAEPYCCQSVMVGCPCFELSCCGPETVSVDCPVQYSFYLNNKGSAVARGVVLENKVPAEFEHASCGKCLHWELGDICPGECKRVDVSYCAKKCGMAYNTAMLKACNCKPTQTTCSTMVEDCCIEIAKVGPEGPITVGNPATYKITAHNPGNVALHKVRVIDTVPGGTRILSAPGAEVAGSTATWWVDRWEPGETKNFEITITSCVHGCLTNQVCVRCDEQCGDCSCFTTKWVGIPAMWVGIKDSVDPVCVGMTTDYCINVQNQGHADDSNVQITVTFPEEMEPVDVHSQIGSRIKGRTVTFDKLPVLQAGRTEKISIKARAVKPGDAKVRVDVSSDLMKEAYSKTEHTQVY